jgi:type II secretory pathway component PulF
MMFDVKAIEEGFIRLQFTGRKRLAIYRKLIRFLKNGVQLTQALDILWNHATEDGKKPKRAEAIALDAWQKAIQNGLTFGRAIRGWVPEKDRRVIEAGEEAGKLELALENAIFIVENERRIKSTLIGGLIYPVLLVFVVIGFLILFGVRVVPAFEDILPRSRWTGAGAQMAMLSDFVNFWLFPCLFALAVMIGVIMWSMPRWTGNMRVRLDRWPPWSLYRLTTGAGFMLTVAAMVRAGVPIPNVLRGMMRDASPWFAERMQRTLHFVNNGNNIGEALYKTKFNFPDKETVQDLRAYANLEGFSDVLEKLGREWIEQSVENIKAQTDLMRNAGIVLVGVTISWLATGIFSLQQQITNGL